LQRATAPTALTTEQQKQRESDIAYWEGSPAVRSRASAADRAEADVVVFMENLPQTLDKWLSIEGTKGNLTDPAITKLEKELNAVTAFMKSRGFLHFDAHFLNVLAHNNHVYFADFGLAISKNFELSAEEKAFFEKHSDYDRYCIVAELAQRAIVAVVGEEKSPAALDDYLSNRPMAIELPPAVASLAQRYRAVAILMDQFFQRLRNQSKNTPYPEAEFEISLRF
jgi:serine/threonine protein kinase